MSLDYPLEVRNLSHTPKRNDDQDDERRIPKVDGGDPVFNSAKSRELVSRSGRAERRTTWRLRSQQTRPAPVGQVPTCGQRYNRQEIMSRRKTLSLVFVFLSLVSSPAFAMAQGGDGASFCSNVCGFSDTLCRFFVWTGTCDRSYYPNGDPGGTGGGGGWNPTSTCTSQVKVGHSELLLSACNDCCGVLHSNPLTDDFHACEGLCIEDHG